MVGMGINSKTITTEGTGGMVLHCLASPIFGDVNMQFDSPYEAVIHVSFDSPFVGYSFEANETVPAPFFVFSVGYGG